MEIYRRDYRAIAVVLIVTMAALTFEGFLSPHFARATTNTQIRQEINIIDGYLYAPSGSYATSSAIVETAASSTYVGNTAYFEVVASTTAATNATISLVNSTSSATAVSITVNGTSYARYRSASFTLPDAATEYTVKLGNESVGKGIIAARIVILQNTASLTSTETQIEVGNQENYTANATSTFAAPKYWYYNQNGWDGSPTFYAEVTYLVINGVASSTTYKVPGTYTGNLPGGTASTTVELYGSGGSGGGASSNNSGGSGGAGGQYAASTFVATTSSHTLVVSATTTATTGGGTQGATSTWDGAMVVAGGGAGGLAAQGAAGTGSTSGCVGTTCNKGGNGFAGSIAAGGSGGGGGGSTGNGGNGTNTLGGSAGGGLAGAGGAAQSSTAVGNFGIFAGGAGGGAFKGSGGSKNGGDGANGAAKITNYIASTTIVLQEDNGQFGSWTDVAGTYFVNTGTIGGGQATRVRSSSFTPTNGHHYRIAFSKGDARTTIAIYNAKIVVDQGAGSPTIDSSYSEANQDSTISLFGDVNSTLRGEGQAFTSGGGTLDSVKFYLKKTGTPTGTITAQIYPVTGTVGTNAKPNPPALATSTSFDVSTLTTSYQINYLQFYWRQ